MEPATAQPDNPPGDRRVLTVPEAAALLRVSAWSVYQLVNRGELRAVRLGRSIRIPAAAVAEKLGEG